MEISPKLTILEHVLTDKGKLKEHLPTYLNTMDSIYMPTTTDIIRSTQIDGIFKTLLNENWSRQK